STGRQARTVVREGHRARPRARVRAREALPRLRTDRRRRHGPPTQQGLRPARRQGGRAAGRRAAGQAVRPGRQLHRRQADRPALRPRRQADAYRSRDRAEPRPEPAAARLRRRPARSLDRRRCEEQLMRAVLMIAFCACAGPDGTPVALPNGGPGIGFDDLRYSPTLRRVLAPAGRAGALDLVAPASLAAAPNPGFSASASYDGGHDFGATSVDEGRGLLFVTDRTSGKLSAVDRSTGTVVGSAALGSIPDYVRYVAATDELWVTEPDASQIEVFAA